MAHLEQCAAWSAWVKWGWRIRWIASEFLHCSCVKEFYQSVLKHVTCATVLARLSAGNADTPIKSLAMWWWWCGGEMAFCAQVAIALSEPPWVLLQPATNELCPCLLGDLKVWAQEGKSCMPWCCLPLDNDVKATYWPYWFSEGWSPERGVKIKRVL